VVLSGAGQNRSRGDLVVVHEDGQEPASVQAQVEAGRPPGLPAAFSEWTSTFTDPRLCAAIVDRLTFDAHIITTGTDSYRLRTAQARHHSARTG
jgi:hypothetical protein